MNKKNFLYGGILLLSASFASCNKSADAEVEAVAETAAQASKDVKIVYVDIDTLMSQYKFCKDYTMLMNKKGENIRATLAQKERALQNQAAAFQKKYEQNGFTTKEQVEQAQMGLQKQQQDLQALNERLSSEFAAEQSKYNEEMRDSIQKFLKDFNKNKKYDMIISKAGDNLLYANPKLDITKVVLAGLNKRYKQSPEVAEKIGVSSDKK